MYTITSYTHYSAMCLSRHYSATHACLSPHHPSIPHLPRNTHMLLYLCPLSPHRLQSINRSLLPIHSLLAQTQLSTMSTLHLYTILLIFSSSILLSESRLSFDYYTKTCPRFQQIITDTITNKQITSPTTAAGTLRLFFHDCILNGCDASILITSNSFNKAERDADLNLSLPGDAFDVIVRAKTALEIECPNVVSCSDILALATRDLVTMVGGPFYQVKLGRKDGLVSKASHVQGHLPTPTMPMSQILSLFASRGFSIQEMVALSGAHTIGFSHCSEFAYRIYNFTKTSPVDPTLNPRFADALNMACATYKSNPTISVFNDIMTPNKFDNLYYQNLPKGLGVLGSDAAMIGDARTKPYAHLYAANQTAFFQAFSRAMEKLSVYGIKMGPRGEVRHRCDAFNNINT